MKIKCIDCIYVMTCESQNEHRTECEHGQKRKGEVIKIDNSGTICRNKKC